MAIKALQYLYLTLTQGSADAFVATSLSTGLTNTGTLAWRIRELLFELGAAGGAQNNGAVGASGIDFGLARVEPAAALNITAKSLIYKYKQYNTLTTSGAIPEQQIITLQYGEDDGPVLVEDTIYGYLDSHASSLSNVVYVRLGLEQIKVTESERLVIQVASLTS